MFSYYGSKTEIVKFYPRPKEGKIIEPFAGAAKYALKHYSNQVLIVDAYRDLINIWKWLQRSGINDLDRLPKQIHVGQSVDDFEFDCEEAKNLFGFLIKAGNERPSKKPTKWTEMRPNRIKFRIEQIKSSLFKIRHWDIFCDDYRNIPNQQATWFIDPPLSIWRQILCSFKDRLQSSFCLEQRKARASNSL